MSVNSTLLLFGNIYNSLTLSSPIGISFAENLCVDILLPLVLLLSILTFMCRLLLRVSVSIAFIQSNPFSLLCVAKQWHEFLFPSSMPSTADILIDFLTQLLLSLVDLNDTFLVRYDCPSCNYY